MAKALRVVPLHHGDDGVGVTITCQGRKLGHVHIPPQRGTPAQIADVIVRKIGDINRLVQIGLNRIESSGPTKEMDDDG